MQELKKPLIKRIIFLENFLHRDEPFHSVPFRQTQPFLLKYFPKYLHEVSCVCSDGSLKKRLKHLKIVRNFYCPTRNGNFWRLAVANKRRSIEGFSHSLISGETCTLEKIRMFQSLKRIHFCLYEINEDDWIDEERKEWERKLYQIHRVCCYLNTTHGLSCLKLSINDKGLFKILSKINSLKRVLNRLKRFEIYLLWHGAYYQAKILQEFSRYKTALKYLTHLTMDLLIKNESFKVLELLPSSCPQLIYLKFSTSPQEMIGAFQHPEELYYERDFEKTNFLECLKDFKCLQKLDLCFYNMFDFFSCCKLPASLRYLNLRFDNFWCNERDFPLQIGMEKLEKLETLNIELLTSRDRTVEIAPDDETEEMLKGKDHLKEHFLKDLLSRVVSPLKKLAITLSRSFYADRSRGTQRFHGDLNLADLLGWIEQLRESLTTLHINDRWLEYRLCLREDELCHFLKLSDLYIESDISPFTDFGKILEIMQPKNEQSKPCVKLDGIKLNSCEALLNFFCRLGEIRVAGDRLLKLHIYPQNMDNDVEYFERKWSHVMEKLGRRLKNIFLEITAIKSTFWEKKETEALLSLFGGFDFQTSRHRFIF